MHKKMNFFDSEKWNKVKQIKILNQNIYIIVNVFTLKIELNLVYK